LIAKPENIVVQKYGGTSVGTIERIKHVAHHIANTTKSGKKVIAVISAMGDQTDELLSMAHSVSRNPPKRELDMLLTSGERIATALVSIGVNENGVKATSFTGSQCGIITDTIHGNARVKKILGHRIAEVLELGHVAVVAGFQGVSEQTKEITTLGRGGTDLSAIALATHFRAERCQLYKDVTAVMTGDPRIVSNPIPIARLSWGSMTELAWHGAGIIHPRGAHLARKFQLPIEIRSSFELNKEGTLIMGNEALEEVVIAGVTHKSNMTICAISTQTKKAQDLLASICAFLWERGESPLISSISSLQAQNNATITIAFAKQFVDEVKTKFETEFGTFHQKNCASVSIVGSGFWQSPEIQKKILPFTTDAIIVDIKNNSITMCVEDNSINQMIQGLHSALVIQ
jgi:aspartate kinase